MRSRLDGPGLFLLNGFFLDRTGATKYGIDGRVFGVVAVVVALVSVATWPAIAIFGV